MVVFLSNSNTDFAVDHVGLGIITISMNINKSAQRAARGAQRAAKQQLRAARFFGGQFFSEFAVLFFKMLQFFVRLFFFKSAPQARFFFFQKRAAGVTFFFQKRPTGAIFCSKVCCSRDYFSKSV